MSCPACSHESQERQLTESFFVHETGDIIFLMTSPLIKPKMIDEYYIKQMSKIEDYLRFLMKPMVVYSRTNFENNIYYKWAIIVSALTVIKNAELDFTELYVKL